jgi:hypothetical protein
MAMDQSGSAILSGSVPARLKWKHSFIEELTDGAEAVIHVVSALATLVELSLNDHEDLKSKISVLKLRTTEVAKKLFYARWVPPSQPDASGKIVNDWTEFLSFVLHGALFLTLHNGKVSPAALQLLLAVIAINNNKFINRVYGLPGSTRG